MRTDTKLKKIAGFFFILIAFLTLSETLSAQKTITGETSSLIEPIPDPSGKNDKASGQSIENPPEKSDEISPETDEKLGDEAAQPYKLRRGDKDFAIEYGISPFNPSNFAGPKEFDVYGRDLHLFSFRFGRVIGTKRNVSYQYSFGVTPLAVFTKNEVVDTEYVSPAETPDRAPTKRETTYGIGFQPVNFKFIFFAKNRLKPYAQVGAGLLFVNKAVPVPRSTLFQFTGDFGGGLMYMISPNRAVSLGYKYFHISNGNINGKINNPGFNANVFYMNYSFFWNRR
ncbi:MAG: hypothetical protein JWN60_689 [Acidobacteria bacterium]|jgi:hypothetical protein|nr:hypothetical protein [Acidobacteriota bacterium]